MKVTRWNIIAATAEGTWLHNLRMQHWYMEHLIIPICYISFLTGWQFAMNDFGFTAWGKWKKIAVQLSNFSLETSSALLHMTVLKMSDFAAVTLTMAKFWKSTGDWAISWAFLTSQLIVSMSHSQCRTPPNETETTWNAFFKPLKCIMIANLASRSTAT